MNVHGHTSTKYSAFSDNAQTMSNTEYEHVNIYSCNSTGGLLQSKRMSWREWICRFCCCRRSEDNQDSAIGSPNSALVGRTGRSYNFNQDLSDNQLPVLTASRVVNDEFATNVECLETPRFEKVKIGRNRSYSPIESMENEQFVRKSGEKTFIREIMACRDSFIKSLEWCDNSLTRGKKGRSIKRDDWVRYDTHEGINVLPILAWDMNHDTNLMNYTK